MTERSHEPKEPNDGATETAAPRRPYVAPCIEQTGDFERLVLNCAHLAGDPKKTGCAFGTQSS